jgi:type I restriction enzyme S subunit
MSEVSYIRLEDVAFARGGSGFPQIYQGGKIGIPFIKVSDMNLPGNERFIYKSNNFLNSNLIKRLNATVFEKNSIVFAKVGAALLLNRRRILSEPTAIDNNMMAVEATNIDFNFLYHFLTTVDFGKFSQPGAVPSINQQHIHNLKLPNFDSKEQKKIAEILTLADEKIELTEKLIEKKKEVFSGLENDLLSSDLSKQFLLSDLGSTYGGLNGKTKEDFGSGSDFITYMQVFGNNTIDESKLGKVFVASNESQNKVKYGDILFTISSETPHELAMASVFTSKSFEPYLNSFCFGFRLNNFDNLVPEFSAYYFRSQIFRKKILPLAQGSTRYNTSKSALMALQIEVPSIEKQFEIAGILNSAVVEFDSLIRGCEKLKLQKQGLMHDLFTGQVRVGYKSCYEDSNPLVKES